MHFIDSFAFVLRGPCPTEWPGQANKTLLNIVQCLKYKTHSTIKMMPCNNRALGGAC